MKDKYKLILLLSLLVISSIPTANFFIKDYPEAYPYVLQLANGKAVLDISLARNEIGIYSQVYFGCVAFSLSYIAFVFCCEVIFCVCLIYTIKNRYHMYKQQIDNFLPSLKIKAF